MRALGVAVLLLCLVEPAAASALVVRLRATVQVRGPEVTLGEVAVLNGPPNAVRAAGAVVVVEDLKPGSTVRLTAPEVVAALRAAGFDPRAVSVVGVREVLVKRSEAGAAVRKGAAVQVVAAVGVVRVTATGVALEAGDVGNVIRVRVLATRREILARIVEPGLVTVTF